MQAGETVKYAGRLHWIIYKYAILWLLAAIGASIAMALVPGGIVLAMVLFLGAAIAFFRAWFQRVTTEIVVTDKRIIHKTGWISRRTEEINITKVETVDVIQGIYGRILGFGTVVIRGIGGSWDPLHRIRAPLALRNAILIG